MGFEVGGSRIDELANELNEDWANWEGNMCNKDDRGKKDCDGRKIKRKVYYEVF